MDNFESSVQEILSGPRERGRRNILQSLDELNSFTEIQEIRGKEGGLSQTTQTKLCSFLALALNVAQSQVGVGLETDPEDIGEKGTLFIREIYQARVEFVKNQIHYLTRALLGQSNQPSDWPY